MLSCRSKLTRLCWLGMEDLKEGKEAMGGRNEALRVCLSRIDSWYLFFSSLQISNSSWMRPWTLQGCPPLTGTSLFIHLLVSSNNTSLSVTLYC